MDELDLIGDAEYLRPRFQTQRRSGEPNFGELECFSNPPEQAGGFER